MQEFNSPEEWNEELERSVFIPEGFSLASVALEFMPRERPAGKPYPMRLSLIRLDKASGAFAGVCTRNAFPGAPVLLARERLAGDRIQAVLINNKISNVGSPTGVRDARDLATELARLTGMRSEHIIPASTGIIGWSLPVDAMKAALPDLVVQNGGALELAKAIMTTDSYPKAASKRVGEGTITIFAKGAGMIEPNMATMLVFVLTDLDQPRGELDAALRYAVERSFNCISVDSDQSTSDMCLLLSSGKKPRVAETEFRDALTELCSCTAAHIVRNGEGTAHVMRVTVEGFGDLCRDVGKAVVNSPLVKTAVYGNDPNVGRLLSSVGDCLGNRGASLPSELLTVTLCGIEVFTRGAFRLDAVTEEKLVAALKNARQDPAVSGFPQHDRYVDIGFRLDTSGTGAADANPRAAGAGSNVPGRAVVLGSDLGYEYVKENADYRS